MSPAAPWRRCCTQTLHSHRGLSHPANEAGAGKGQVYAAFSAHREENIDTEKNFTGPVHLHQPPWRKSYDMPILVLLPSRAAASGWRPARLCAGRAGAPARAAGLPRLQPPADERLLCQSPTPARCRRNPASSPAWAIPFPAVCIRTSTERPEALDKGCFILAGISQRRRGAGGGDSCRHERRMAMPASPCRVMKKTYPPRW